MYMYLKLTKFIMFHMHTDNASPMMSKNHTKHFIMQVCYSCSFFVVYKYM